jgi:hypothetical protein
VTAGSSPELTSLLSPTVRFLEKLGCGRSDGEAECSWTTTRYT